MDRHWLFYASARERGDKSMIEEVRRAFETHPVIFQDHMVMGKKPHTATVAALPFGSCGRETASYYFLARYFDRIEDGEAEAILEEIAKLQITDETSGHYGCMRWYREEPYILDTNGAFFVLLPVSLAFVLCENKMTEREKQIIRKVLCLAGHWFTKEGRGAMFYTNKVMSDGAMLALISHITGQYGADSTAFWERWNTYVNTRGYGWGENISSVYTVVMLNAMNAALLVMEESPNRKQLKEKKEKLLDYIAFHGGKEFVPAIRSYNFSGGVNYGGAIRRAFDGGASYNSFWDMIATVLLACTNTKRPKFEAAGPGMVRKEHAFDDTAAYTWMGKGIRLGSVSRFPVMPGCYGGLGWQSMPVSAMAEKEAVSYLRLRTIQKGEDRTHPADSDFSKAYLSHELFDDTNRPSCTLRAAQDQNIVIAVRSIQHLANHVEGILDEWCMPRSEREVETLSVKDRLWYLIRYEDCALALTPLEGIAASSGKREGLPCKISRQAGVTTISTELYSGGENMAVKAYLESAWIIVALDDSIVSSVEKESCAEYLSRITVESTQLAEYAVPRTETSLTRHIWCSDGVRRAEIFVDPCENPDELP